MRWLDEALEGFHCLCFVLFRAQNLILVFLSWVAGLLRSAPTTLLVQNLPVLCRAFRPRLRVRVQQRLAMLVSSLLPPPEHTPSTYLPQQLWGGREVLQDGADLPAGTANSQVSKKHFIALLEDPAWRQRPTGLAPMGCPPVC